MSNPSRETEMSTITPVVPHASARHAESAMLSGLGLATLLAGAGMSVLGPALVATAAILAAAVLGLAARAGEISRVGRSALVLAVGAAVAVMEPAMTGLSLLYALTIAATMPLRLGRTGGHVVTVGAAAAAAAPVALSPFVATSLPGLQAGLLGTGDEISSLVAVVVVLATGLYATTTARSVEQAHDAARRSNSQAIRADARLSHAIRHDRLTGLPNRNALLDRAVRALASAEELGEVVGLLVLEVDRFAALQDTIGADGAEEALEHVALRLRASRPEHDVVARIGEAQFAVLIEGVGREGCGGIARRMTSLLAEPLTAARQEISVTCSVGVVLSSPDLSDAGELLRAAEEATRAAQNSGRSRWAQYDQAMRVHTVSQSFLELELRQALRAGSLGVAFQPFVRLAEDGTPEGVAGVEALARWTRRDGTAVPPQRFLAMADDLGLGATLGFQVLDRALDALAHWHQAGCRVPQVSVNVSRSQLTDPDFASTVQARLSARALAPECLAVDMRGADLEDDGVLTTLGMLRSLGVTVCVSGLGSAGSSLAGLGGAPVDRVVIDRTLIAGHTAGRTVARHLTALCRDLNLDTVADGVETPDHLLTVRALGIRHAQGFLFGRPVRAEDVAGAVAALSAGPLVRANRP